MSTREGEAPIAVYGALAANGLIAATKFAVAAMSGSSALLSEAIHSTVDTANELLLLLGLRRAEAEPSASHPFGYGKELYFWGFVVAMVIFAGGGAVSIYEGLIRLGEPDRPHRIGLAWKLGVLGVAFVFESASFVVALRAVLRRPGETRWHALRRSRDPSVYTVVAEDAAALAGLLVAAVGVVLAHVLHAPWIDAAASIVIGLILCAVAVLLAIKSRSLLVGKSADRARVDGIREAAMSAPGIRRAGCPLTMQLGPDELLVTLDVWIRPEAHGAELAKTLEELERRVRAKNHDVKRVFVEVHVDDGTMPSRAGS